ncbi:hypothetical protein niasHT_012573 [Heterodera trifolii]|uniref:Chitin-binding type-2 domain-containing protein n=1 Tax=Heterodera trifolii TaxID=157864 RepID=A0ABD2L1G3_9BILA
MYLFRRRLAIFIILLAFFPLFCGALRCLYGTVGYHAEKLYEDEEHCKDTPYCFKVKCSTELKNETMLIWGCVDFNNCTSLTEEINQHIGPPPPRKWKCTCQYGHEGQNMPFPMPGKSVCTRSFNADKTSFQLTQNFVNLIKRMGITENITNQECGKKGEVVGCQTYRCKKADGFDLFVINGCAAADLTCSHGELDRKYCKRSKKFSPDCEVCVEEEGGFVCNANKTKMINPDIECHVSFANSSLYTPSAELLEIVNKEKGLKKCANNMQNCQTNTCTDNATRYPLFTFKDCAEPGEKCKTDELIKFCAPPLKLDCNICEGSKCNKRMPIPDKFTPLQYFAWDNCAPAAANCKPEAAKFSRRFAIGQECEKVYNESVWNSMGEDKGKSIYDEYENSCKDNANGQVFLADFIRAIIEDEKKTEGNEEEDK